MKSIKLAMILLVGQCVFNPLVALSKPLFTDATQVSVKKNGVDYSCYAVERAGNYFTSGVSELCERAGYERQANYGGDILGVPEKDLNLSVVTYDGEYYCYYAERANQYFKKGVAEACEKAGYTRQFVYEPTSQDLVDAANDLRDICTGFITKRIPPSDQSILSCAKVGIDVTTVNFPQ